MSTTSCSPEDDTCRAQCIQLQPPRPPTRAVLCVGLVCQDTLLVFPEYPQEDSEIRCLKKMVRVGGNAANTCTVLSQLGAACEFLGTLTETCSLSEFVRTHFQYYKIDYENSPFHNDCKYPTAVIIISNANGSRTILHHSDEWPEVTAEDFSKLDLSKYSWIHFQGRNTEEVQKMVSMIEEWNSLNEEKRITISVELERTRETLLDLFTCGDVMFIAKDFAKFLGGDDMHAALEIIEKKVKPNATIIIPWGEKGAIAYNKETGVVESRSFPPENVVDSVGAGDTFIASVIHFLNHGDPLQMSIIKGCQIAGAKVGMYGYDVGEFYRTQVQNVPA